MSLFLLGLAILLVGYFFYGKLVERVVGTDDRETPATRLRDGVDYLPLPCWKNMLIQLLNIAGVGPVIGVILGIKFGVIAFLLIPVGNIIGGAVHDFVAGMMSLRNDGANLPRLLRITTGQGFYRFFSVFMIFLLLLVVAVFINIPAQLVAGMLPESFSALHPAFGFWAAAVVIFLYYIAATLFPVDKIIGKLYPFFGALLIIGSLAIFFKLMYDCATAPELLEESPAFQENMFTAAKNQPVIPLLFVTIACGILSGFHATQSPIIARTMKSESEARASFYGMMVVEGVIAMIWAAAGLAIYNLFPKLMAMAPGAVLTEITTHFLGEIVGGVTVLSVIILAVTSGDTAMRSLRLSIAEIFSLNQAHIAARLRICIPLIAIVAVLLFWSNLDAGSFAALWNYFAWGNQVLAACTLTAATVWLTARRRSPIITLIPGAFMTFIVVTFILWTSKEHGGPFGLGLELEHAKLIGAFVALVVTIWAYLRGRDLEGEFDD